MNTFVTKLFSVGQMSWESSRVNFLLTRALSHCCKMASTSVRVAMSFEQRLKMTLLEAHCSCDARLLFCLVSGGVLNGGGDGESVVYFVNCFFCHEIPSFRPSVVGYFRLTLAETFLCLSKERWLPLLLLLLVLEAGSVGHQCTSLSIGSVFRTSCDQHHPLLILKHAPFLPVCTAGLFQVENISPAYFFVGVGTLRGEDSAMEHRLTFLTVSND